MIKTCSLGLSKQLKEAGFPQETEFYYIDDGYGYIYQYNKTSFFTIEKKLKAKVVFAPTAEEILERLPANIKEDYNLQIGKENEYNYVVWYRKALPQNYRTYVLFSDKSLTEAAGKMWLYLKKEGLL